MSPIKGGGMGKLQGRATHASLDQRSLFVLALAATAFALVLASIWSARLESAAQPEQAVNFARLVKIATCFTIAYIFRSFIPPIRQLFLGGVACFALYGALYLGTQPLPASSPEHLPLAYLAQLFSGVGDALVILLLAHLLSTYPPRVSAIAMPRPIWRTRRFFAYYGTRRHPCSSWPDLCLRPAASPYYSFALC